MNNEPAPDATKPEEYFTVEKIVGSKFVNGQKFYEIKWVGYSSKVNTWEPLIHLHNVLYMVDEYENKKKAKQGQSGNKGGKWKMKSIEELTDNTNHCESRTGPEWNAYSLNVISGSEIKEGSFNHNKAKRIVCIVEVLSEREWNMKVEWEKDMKTGKRPKPSIYTNTALKQIDPDLLFDFYEN